MHIAFNFEYKHDDGLFMRLYERIRQGSALALRFYHRGDVYTIEASGEQNELETLAEQISRFVPQSIFLSGHSIEEVTQPYQTEAIDDINGIFRIPYCLECEENIIRTLDPFKKCQVCGAYEIKPSADEMSAVNGLQGKTSSQLFDTLAERLLDEGQLCLSTSKGVRNFSLLTENEENVKGILICDPSEISDYFVITQDELDTLMMIEKPSVRLKPKLKLRAEYDLKRSFYPVFFADDKMTLALSSVLSKRGVFALYCDRSPSLRMASALQERVIVETVDDMLPWRNSIQLEKASLCRFGGYTAVGDSKGLLLDKDVQSEHTCVEFIPNMQAEISGNGILFEPSHAALRSVVLEHQLQGKSLCGIYLSHQYPSSICSFSSKIGYTSLAEFSYDIENGAAAMLEAISQMDESGYRLVNNYKNAYSGLYEQVLMSRFETDKDVSSLTKIWAMAAVILGFYSGNNIQDACDHLEATALEFTGKSGPRIDYKVIKTDRGYQVDPRLVIRSAMSFKLAGVDEYLLSFGFIDSLADFIAQQAELADGNIAIEGVSLSGSLFENRQLLMRTYNALSPNYKVYRNERLGLDGANMVIGAITLGSE